MNELAERTGEDALDRRGTEPRAVVHKNILERAARNPDAPMSALATDVPGATVELVERVLGEYGDPGAQDGDQTQEPEAEMQDVDHEDSTESEPDPVAEQTPKGRQIPPPDTDALTEKQRSTLRTIQEHPDATQAELAKRVGVSSATINTRVNNVDGFDWDRRHEFVERLFEGDEEPGERDDGGDDLSDEPDEFDRGDRPAGVPRGDRQSDEAEPPSEALSDRIEELTALVESVADCVDGHERRTSGPFEDPELVHKLLRACLDDDDISADEELEIVKAVIG